MSMSDKNNEGKRTGQLSGNRARYLRQKAAQSSLISGPGLFFTCPRGKESASVYELKDLLERVAEELGIELEENHSDQTLKQKENLECEDSEEVGSDDIETQINKELDGMRTQGTCLLNNGKKRTRPHSPFTSKKMDCECLGFIHFPKACDPVHFSGYIVKQIQEGKPGYGLRFIQRITPVSMTCSATNPELFEKMAKKLLEPQFGIKFCPRKSETVVENLENPLRVGLKFRIESIVRCHDKPLNRSEVIRIIGDVVKRYNEDDFIMASDEDSVGHDPVKLKHKVDISDSDIVILVSVYRYVAGLSVVRNYDREGKRFNLQAIAQAREQATSNNSNSETIDKKKVAHS